MSSKNSADSGDSDDGAIPRTTKLLARLERDLAPPPNNKNNKKQKKSVQDCLRSKVLPCAPVQQILRTCQQQPKRSSDCDGASSFSISPLDVTLSHSAVLGSYLLSFIKTGILQQQLSKKKKPSIWYISRMATVMRFLELLFELSTLEQPQPQRATTNNDNDMDDKENYDDDDDESTVVVFDRPQLRKYILQEIKSLLSVVVDILPNETTTTTSTSSDAAIDCDNRVDYTTSNDHGDDEAYCCYTSDTTAAFDARQVAAFCFGSLLRLDPYIRANPVYISPVYKGLCNIVMTTTTTCTHNNNNNNNTVDANDVNKPMTTTFLSHDLVHQAIRSVVRYIQEGLVPMLEFCQTIVRNRDTPNEAANSSPQTTTSSIAASLDRQVVKRLEFQIKILVFLLSRLATLIQVVPADGLDDATIGVLLLVRGIQPYMDSLVEESSSNGDSEGMRAASVSTLFRSAVQKSDMVLQGIIVREESSPGDMTRRTCETNNIGLIASSECTGSLGTISASALLSKSMLRSLVSWAKVSVWVGYLKTTTTAATTTKTTATRESRSLTAQQLTLALSILRELVFSALPNCMTLEHDVKDDRTKETSSSFGGMVQSVLQLGSRMLLLCAASDCVQADHDDPGRTRFHNLLVSWLASSSPISKEDVPCHPFSTELWFSLFALFIRDLSKVGSSNHADELLRLLVLLLFDNRTENGLRSNISTFLCFVMNLLVQDENDFGSAVATGLSTQIRGKYATLVETCSPCSTKKRKRQRSEHLASAQVVNSVSEVISVMKQLGIGVGGFDKSVYPSILTLKKGCAHFTLSLIDCRPRMTKELRQTITSLIKILRTTKKGSINSSRVLLMGSSLVDFTRACLAELQVNATIGAEDCAAFVDLYNSLTETFGEDTSTVSRQEARLSMWLSVSMAVGELGAKLSESTSKEIIARVAVCYYRILSSGSWVLRSIALTSLVKFASSIPSIHKHCLPRCIPPSMQHLLQCRLKSARAVPSDLVRMKRRLENELRASTSGEPCRGQLFKETTSVLIQLGSYAVTMPTQEDRTALVIFPPGEESLRDIRFMLGLSQDENPPNVQQVSLARPVSFGNCKLCLE